MHKISLFAMAVALIATGFGAWAVWNEVVPSFHHPTSILEQILTGKMNI
jgi:hypothetical protein